MGTEEGERALEHVTACTECSETYRALSMLRAEAPAFDPGAPRDQVVRPFPAQGVPAWAGWAAAGLAAASLASWLLLERRPTAPVTRAPNTGMGLVLLEPAGTLSDVPRGFRWSTVDGAESYRVRLFREDGLLLWTSEAMTENRADWPGELPLEPGRYFWDVEALREGRSIVHSPPQAFVRAP
jgi:hypothetical protein